MLSFSQHLKILLWKNFSLQRRQLGSLIKQLVVPWAIALIFAVVKSSTADDPVAPSSGVGELKAFDFSSPFVNNNQCHVDDEGFRPNLAIVASEDDFNSFQSFWNDRIEVSFETPDLQRFESQSDVENVVKEKDYPIQGNGSTDRICGAVVFTSSLDVSKPTYTLQFNATDDSSCGTNGRPDQQGRSDSPTIKYYGLDTGYDWYSCTGFVQMELLIDSFLVQRRSPDVALPADLNVTMLEMPTPEYTPSTFFSVAGQQFPLILFIAFAFTTSKLVGSVLQERESKIRDMMQLMGLKLSSLYISWWLTYAIIYIVIAIGLALILKYGKVFEHSSIELLIIFFILFGFASASLGLLLSSPFDNAKAGAIGAFVIFYLLQFVTSAVQDSWTVADRTWASLIPHFAFALGVQNIVDLELQGPGLTWSTISEVSFGNKMQNYYIMLAVDTVYLFLLYVYFDQVLPHQYGTRLPWTFPVSKSYWFPKKFAGGEDGEPTSDEDEYEGPPPDPANPNIEKLGPSDLQRLEASQCIDIRALRKTFDGTGSEKVKAVDDLNLQVFPSEIYALLGHNGAGKTTTMSILTGMLHADSGSAKVFGRDILKEGIEGLRSSLGLGVCPQHDVLWNELTVKEHLQIFGALRGLSSKEIAQQSSNLLGEVGLVDKVQAKAGSLSAGMKRKLSVAIAFMGESRLIVLDEPTSGMDPYARRHMWELLKKKRQSDRVIILSTHYMDEAEVLGDRIAIMHAGHMEASGSSLFLKQQFGCGYNLTFVKAHKDKATTQKIVSAVSKYTHPTKPKIVSDIGSELVLQLPFSASSAFEPLLKEVEGNKRLLGVSGYGVSATKLEEVFLQVASGHNPDVNVREGGASFADDPSAPQFSSKNLVESRVLWHRQLWAILVKRSQYARRDLRTVMCLLVMPIIMIAVGLGVLKTLTFMNDPASLTLQLSVYNKDVGGGVPKSVLPWSGEGSALTFAQNTGMFEIGVDQDEYIDTSGGRRRLQGTVESCVSFLKSSECGEYFEKGSECINEMPSCISSNMNSLLSQSSACGSNTFIINNINSIVQNFCFGGEQGQCVALGMNQGGGLQEWTERCQLWSDMSNKLFETQNVYEASRYGSFYVDNIEETSASDVGHVGLAINTTAIHGAGIYTNLFSSQWLQAQGVTGFASTVTNEPLPLSRHQEDTATQVSAFIPATYMLIAFAFIPAGVAQFIVRERQVGAKHQQFVSGVSYSVYWVANFIVDTIFFLPAVFLTLVLFIAFDVPSLTSADGWPAFLTLMLFFAPCSVAFTYVISFCFKNYVSAQNAMLLINIFLGLILGVASWIMRNIDGTKEVDKTLRFFYRLIPGFCLCDGVLSIPSVGISGDTFGDSVWGWNVIGWDLVFLAGLTPLYLALAVGIDMATSYPAVQMKLQRMLGRKPPSAVDASDPDTDSFVKKEEVRVARGESGILTVKTSHKLYPSKPPKHAVKGVSFAVPEGEVFGLLGVNGAGKTSLMKMCVGEHAPTSGSISVGGFDIATELFKCRQLIGYCPQFDALLEPMTVREHLYLYARIKGIGSDRIPYVVEEQIKKMDLAKFADKKAGTLSGGNKRKLSVAIAMIGNPKLVFLDEPSCGMDPFARRFMWGVVQSISRVASVVVTTHSMEEAEALSTRIAIMAGGRFRCLGTTQEIKNTRGQGYELFVRTCNPSSSVVDTLLKNWNHAPHSLMLAAECMNLCFSEERKDSLKHSLLAQGVEGVQAKSFAEWWACEDMGDELKRFLQKHFPGASLLEKVSRVWRFQLPSVENSNTSSLADMFAKIEKEKARGKNIEEYSLSQISLEQIFNALAKEDGVRQGSQNREE